MLTDVFQIWHVFSFCNSSSTFIRQNFFWEIPLRHICYWEFCDVFLAKYIFSLTEKVFVDRQWIRAKNLAGCGKAIDHCLKGCLPTEEGRVKGGGRGVSRGVFLNGSPSLGGSNHNMFHPKSLSVSKNIQR